MNTEVTQLIETSLKKLLKYCQANNWAGWDPYDALNSRVFPYIPFVQNRIGRVLFTQFMKRSPVNFRPIMLVPKSENPKAIALFLMSFLKLESLGLLDNHDLISLMIQKLITLRSPINSINTNERKSQVASSEVLTRFPNIPSFQHSNILISNNPINPSNPYFCWGYNFDWQARDGFVLRYTPNIICTTFAGNALLDAYDKLKGNTYLEMAISAGNFILKGLNITESKEGLCFSYTSSDHGQVHNANLLGAAFLARLYSLTDNQEFYEYSLSAAKFSVSKQNQDGSWPYGEGPKQKWIDNFHTGYNLCALKNISKYTGYDLSDSIERGFLFYKKKFFVNGNLAKYYNDRTYPIDIHSIAQSIITFLELRDIDANNIKQASSLCLWAIGNIQSKEGHFYYQKGRFITNGISYIRWSQAWMLYALAYLIDSFQAKH